MHGPYIKMTLSQILLCERLDKYQSPCLWAGHLTFVPGCWKVIEYLVSGGHPLMFYLVCRVELIIWHLRHPIRRMLMEPSIFWTCHVWVLICVWSPTIKLPFVIFWLGKKLVSYQITCLGVGPPDIHIEQYFLVIIHVNCFNLLAISIENIQSLILVAYCTDLDLNWD